MKEELIEELKNFKTKLNSIDARYETIKENGFEHIKHISTLREIEIILIHIQNRVDRFYTKEYQYNVALKNLTQYLNAFKKFYGEIKNMGIAMEDCKQRIIGIIEGIIEELQKYDFPSDKDPKFNL